MVDSGVVGARMSERAVKSEKTRRMPLATMAGEERTKMKKKRERNGVNEEDGMFVQRTENMTTRETQQ